MYSSFKLYNRYNKELIHSSLKYLSKSQITLGDIVGGVRHAPLMCGFTLRIPVEVRTKSISKQQMPCNIYQRNILRNYALSAEP